ncbi:MAG: hypothetical protein HY706_02700 [Candidatus Hydrogenedentes bacterium]|nr:hypothetical protein [Candidatus Hydrogenedentota bacterium]
MKPQVRVVILLLLAGLGVPVFLLGGLLQINLFGHGGVTPEQRFGVLLMFLGPGFTLSCSLAALGLARSVAAKVIAGMGTFLGGGLLILVGASLFLAHQAEQQRQKLRQIRSEETRYFAKTYQDVLPLAGDGVPEIIVVGRYDAGKDSIIDGFFLGPREMLNPETLAVPKGTLTRFTWVNPMADPLPEDLGLAPPAGSPITPFPIPSYGPGGKVTYELLPKDDPGPPVNRFLVLLSRVGGRLQLVSPFGTAPLPPVSKQPLRIGTHPRFRDLQTSENAALLGN